MCVNVSGLYIHLCVCSWKQRGVCAHNALLQGRTVILLKWNVKCLPQQSRTVISLVGKAPHLHGLIQLCSNGAVMGNIAVKQHHFILHLPSHLRGWFFLLSAMQRRTGLLQSKCKDRKKFSSLTKWNTALWKKVALNSSERLLLRLTETWSSLSNYRVSPSQNWHKCSAELNVV